MPSVRYLRVSSLVLSVKMNEVGITEISVPFFNISLTLNIPCEVICSAKITTESSTYGATFNLSGYVGHATIFK